MTTYIATLDRALERADLQWPASPSLEDLNQYDQTLDGWGVGLRNAGSAFRKHPTREAWLIASVLDLTGNLLLDFSAVDRDGNKRVPDSFEEGCATLVNMVEELRNLTLQDSDQVKFAAARCNARETWERKAAVEHPAVFRFTIVDRYDADALKITQANGEPEAD